MNEADDPALNDYYSEAANWSDDRTRALAGSRKVAWMVASAAGVIALLEGIALILLVPLKTIVPYTLLVDRQTGYVEAVQPLERATITPDAAMVRSFLVQYVIGRESFDRAIAWTKARWSPAPIPATSHVAGLAAAKRTALPREPRPERPRVTPAGEVLGEPSPGIAARPVIRPQAPPRVNPDAG